MLDLAAQELRKLLRTDIDLRREVLLKDRKNRADALFLSAKGNFVAELKARADRGAILTALRQLSVASAILGRNWTPLLVVPFMGPQGAELCQSAGVNWIDLSGNANIETSGLTIFVDARPNQFIRRGRPRSVFAPKSARVARWLLTHPFDWFIQRELARLTGLSEALAGRVVKRLESDGLLARNEIGAVRPRDPMELMLAWRDQSDFRSNRIIRGHVAGRSGEQVAIRVAGALGAHGARYAATGLTAAWSMAPFAAYRTVSMYVDRLPGEACLGNMGFRRDDAGANVWLVIPKDEGVFQSAASVGGIACVHPVQVYVDLKGHPERAEEAAQELLGTRIEGSFRGK